MTSKGYGVAVTTVAGLVLAGTVHSASSAERRVIVDRLEMISRTEAGAPLAKGAANLTAAKPGPDGTIYPVISFTYSGSDLGPSDPALVANLYTKNLATDDIHALNTEAGTGLGTGIWIVPVPSAKFVAMSSVSSVLTPGTGSNGQIYLRSTAGATPGPFVRISNGPGSVPGNGNSQHPDVSVNGRYVCYYSAATNLVSGDDNRKTDIFVYDRTAKTTTRVSHVTGSADDANKESSNCAFAGKKTLVAFDSDATNIVAGDTNRSTDIFLAELGPTGKVTRVSTTSEGKQANGGSYQPSFSADGRWMAFESFGSNLEPDGANTYRQVYVKDLKTGAVTRVSDTFGTAATATARTPRSPRTASSSPM